MDTKAKEIKLEGRGKTFATEDNARKAAVQAIENSGNESGFRFFISRNEAGRHFPVIVTKPGDFITGLLGIGILII